LARASRPILWLLPESLSESDRVARMRRVASVAEEARRFAETLAVFGPAEAVALTGHAVDPDALVEPVRRSLAAVGDHDAVNRLLHVDAELSLADDLLIVADHMAMASSVELRVPFLDLEFLALAEAMPGAYKVSRLAERKWMYRRAVEPLVPLALRPRLTSWRARLGRKAGFTAPLERWFGRWVAQEAERYLLGPHSCVPGVLRADGLERLVREARDRGRPRSRQLLSLYVLETWLRGGWRGEGIGIGASACIFA
jgi:hypothetical protein